MTLLTEQEIKDILIPLFIKQDQASIHWPDIFEEVALIEAKVIEKIKARGKVGVFADVNRLNDRGALWEQMIPEAHDGKEFIYLYRLP